MRHRTQINNRLLGLTLLLAALPSFRAFTPACGGSGLGGVWHRAGGTQVGGSARLARPALRMSTTSNVGTSEQVQDVGRGTLMAQAGVSPLPSRRSLARSLSLPLLSPFIVAWLPTTVFSCSRHVFSCSRHGAWLARATFDGSRLSALLPCAPYVLCEGNGSGCKWSMWCLRVSILPASFVCVMCLCMPVSACLCLCEWGVYVGTGQRRGGGGEQEGQGIV